LQWIQANGFGVPAEPILREMDNFKNMDAILDLSDPDNPKEPEWPEADFVVGNPPFLGGNRIRQELGDYVDVLFALYQDRVPASADLCCYWFEKARQSIEEGKCERAGLLATQGMRGGANRQVLTRIKDSDNIFFAESDRNWILDGATVHISMVGFDNGWETHRTLDGAEVSQINSNLTSSTGETFH
jgi:type II restriction/modification system DNA methylase subunit YeeA